MTFDSGPELPSNSDNHESLPRWHSMEFVINKFLSSDDADSIAGMSERHDVISYVYGRLSDEGYDADAVLLESGVIQEAMGYEV